MFEVTSPVFRVCLLMFLRSSASLCPFGVECGLSTSDDRGVSASLKRSLGIRDLRSLGGACLPLHDVSGARANGLASGAFPLERKYRFSFRITITRANALDRRSRPDNPMAKLSKKSRCPEAPAPVSEPAPRVARRREGADQRLRRHFRATPFLPSWQGIC